MRIFAIDDSTLHEVYHDTSNNQTNGSMALTYSVSCPSLVTLEQFHDIPTSGSAMQQSFSSNCLSGLALGVEKRKYDHHDSSKHQHRKKICKDLSNDASHDFGALDPMLTQPTLCDQYLTFCQSDPELLPVIPTQDPENFRQLARGFSNNLGLRSMEHCSIEKKGNSAKMSSSNQVEICYQGSDDMKGIQRRLLETLNGTRTSDPLSSSSTTRFLREHFEGDTNQIAGSLWLLLHSWKCKQSCGIPHCSVMKNVVEHSLHCNIAIGRCKPACNSARSLLLHYRYCGAGFTAVWPKCEICHRLKSAQIPPQTSITDAQDMDMDINDVTLQRNIDAKVQILIQEQVLRYLYHQTRLPDLQEIRAQARDMVLAEQCSTLQQQNRIALGDQAPVISMEEMQPKHTKPEYFG